MRKVIHSARAFLGIIVLACVGCSGESGEFNPNAPAPGEQNRKDQMQQKQYGAESIEQLREMYLIAHQKKDMDLFRHMLGWNVGRLNDKHRHSWGSVAQPKEKLMIKMFGIPIKDVEFLAGPGPRSEYGKSCAFYRHRVGQPKQGVGISGDIYGRFILIAEDGRRIDPFYVVLDYYGLYIVSTQPWVVEDAYVSYENSRPPIWLPVPMEPKTPEEKALYEELRH